MATLEQLEGDDWGDPVPDSTPLVRRTLRLRRMPVETLSTEDLRLLIGQGVGLEHLIPRALDVAEANPLAAGDLYPGDLLVALLAVPLDHWQRHPDQSLRMNQLAASLAALQPELARCTVATPTPDEAIDRYEGESPQFVVRVLEASPGAVEDGGGRQSILVEGSAEGLRLLAEVLLGLAETARDDGFQLSPDSAGHWHFSQDSPFGLYLHRIGPPLRPDGNAQTGT